MAGRVIAFVYGVLCYVVFLAVFLYAIGFVGNVVVPQSVDAGIEAPVWTALAVDVLLLGLFAVQHSVMARQWFKRVWTKTVPWHVERSTYVLMASAVLALVFWQWRSIPRVLWDVDSPAARALLTGLFWAGWALVLASTFMISHFHLFGLKQVSLHLRNQRDEPQPLRTPLLYRYVRHPLYLGFIVAFWSTPRMTAGHLLFAAVCTAYILVAIQFEERDLLRHFGEPYRLYRARVPMILPWRAPRG